MADIPPQRRHMESLPAMVFDWLADVPRAERPNTRVLDLPGGAGLLAAGLTAAGFDVVYADLLPEYGKQYAEKMRGMTLDEAMRITSRGKGWLSESVQQQLFGGPSPIFPESLPCERADLEAPFPWKDGQFDVAMCIEGIEHVSDRMSMLREFRRVLKPGGSLFISTPNLLNLRSRFTMLVSGFRTFASWLDEYSGVQMQIGDRVYHGHAFMLDYNEMRYSLFHAGFKVKRVLASPTSRSSVAMKWLLWPLVWLGTWRICKRADYIFERYRKTGKVPADAPSPVQEIRRHLMSPELLYGKNLAVEAEAF